MVGWFCNWFLDEEESKKMSQNLKHLKYWKCSEIKDDDVLALNSPKSQLIFAQKGKYTLVLFCKKLKSFIEEEFNIEQVLESNTKVTWEMEFYAQIYETEHLLRTSSSNLDLFCISKFLDSVCENLQIRANITDQLKFIQFSQIPGNQSLSKEPGSFCGSLRDSVVLNSEMENVQFWENLG